MAYTPPAPGSSNWDVTLNAALDDIHDTALAAQADVGDALAGNGAVVGATQDTTSTTYADLATAGPACSITLDQPRKVLVFVKSQVMQASTTDDVFAAFAASGATTVVPADFDAVRHNGSGTAEQYASVAVIDCNAGTTTFTMKYRVDGGTGRFANRVIAVSVIA